MWKLKIRRELEDGGFQYRDVRMARHKDTGKHCCHIVSYYT